MEWGIPVAVAVILGISGIVYYCVRPAKHSTPATHSKPPTPSTIKRTKAATRRLELRTRSIRRENPDLSAKEALLEAIAETPSRNATLILAAKKNKGTPFSNQARNLLEARTKTR